MGVLRKRAATCPGTGVLTTVPVLLLGILGGCSAPGHMVGVARPVDPVPQSAAEAAAAVDTAAPEPTPPDPTAPVATPPALTPAGATPTVVPTAGRPGPSFPEGTAVPCAGRPTADQVVAIVRSVPHLLPPGLTVAVRSGPVCAGRWQYTVLGAPDREPLQVLTQGLPDAPTFVTAGTNVCTTEVTAGAPPGILAAAHC